MIRCRCWRRQYTVVWTGFGRYILVREKCEMHRKRDEMTERLRREIRMRSVVE